MHQSLIRSAIQLSNAATLYMSYPRRKDLRYVLGFSVAGFLLIPVYLLYHFDILTDPYLAEFALVLTSAFAIGVQVVRKDIFTLYGLILVSIIIYHATIPFAHVFFVPFEFDDSARVWELVLPEDSYILAVLLANLGVVCFGLTGAIARDKSLRAEQAIVAPSRRQAQATYIFAIALLAISIYPFLAHLSLIIKLAAEYGYGGRWMRDDVNVGFEKLAPFANVSAFLLLSIARSQYRKTAIPLSLAIITLHSLAYLYLGNRATALLPLVAYIWVWNKSVSPLKANVLIPFSLLLVFLYGGVQVARVSEGSIGEKLGSALSAGVDDYMSVGLYIYVLAAVIELVPKWESFSNGGSYLAGFWLLLPHLGDGAHPAVALLPRDFIEEAYFPNHPDYWGVGFSIIAEGYYNFGWFGSPIAMLVFGFVFSKLSLKAESAGSTLTIAFIGIAMSFVLFLGRTYFGHMPRNLLWYGIIPCVAIIFLVSFRPGGVHPSKTVGKNFSSG